MLHPESRRRQNGTQEWLGAIFTLLVLTGIYSSMDKFSSFSEGEKTLLDIPEVRETSSVASPYWNKTLEYGFRSLNGDVYTSSGSEKGDTVIVTSSGNTLTPHEGVRVSYYKDTPIDQIDRTLVSGSPRAYSRLSHGIAVIEGDLDSPSAKTIFSTLHSR